MTNIGDRIRDRRIKAGLTAEQLARKLEKSRATIYRYESSDAENMPISVLTPLAKALGTTPADLMGWEAPAAKATINDNSLEQDLFQYYTYRPKAVQLENHHAILGTTINETAEPVACGLVTILRFWYILKLPAEVG